VADTQAFNTTTSMGRLTLNVLLSFAQVEREVTGERIRDKIAASKKLGMWTGGGVPLANIGGRAEFITFSLDGSTTWNPASWFTSLRGKRAWTTLRPPLAEGAAPKPAAQ
jgi:hypothetical protein